MKVETQNIECDANQIGYIKGQCVTKTPITLLGYIIFSDDDLTGTSRLFIADCTKIQEEISPKNDSAKESEYWNYVTIFYLKNSILTLFLLNIL